MVTFAKDSPVRELAGLFIKTARGIVPSKETLESLHREIDALGDFMKEGEGEREFRVSPAGGTIGVTHIPGGVVVHCKGLGKAIVEERNYDGYLADVRSWYDKLRDKTEYDIALDLCRIEQSRAKANSGTARIGARTFPVSWMPSIVKEIKEEATK